MKFINLAGKKFNKLTVIRRVKNSPTKQTKWLCKCECGKETIVIGGNLKNNHVKSCGCYRIEWPTTSGKHFKKHGISGTPLYNSWKDMFKRTKATSGKNYENYVKRGIKVCKRWQKLENFLEDMKKTYFNEAQIDRINNDGNYEPKNCRWVTREEQMNNTRHNVKLTFKGKTQNLVQWAKELNINEGTLRDRIKRYHWNVNKALTTPTKI